jgi:mycothiol system anti-sigma-R factor
MKEDCRVTLEKAYLYLDGELLSETERVEIRGHLEACRPCLERYGLDAEVSTLLARLKGCQPCPTSVKQRIKTMLQEQ